MKPILVINDIHIGVQRAAGTTPASAANLRAYLQGSFANLIFDHLDKDLLILGDLFDAFSVDVQEVLGCYLTLNRWVEEHKDSGTLYLVAGNHDIGKRTDKLSSFGLLAELLVSRHPGRVEVIDKSLRSFGRIHIIPHCMNQEIFDLEMAKALELEPGWLLLHANCMNNFTEHSDHSLNVNEEWLGKLAGQHVLGFAHEHQGRKLNRYASPIHVFGNQFPSSVSDCLAHGDAQRDGLKRALVIEPDLGYSEIVTWEAIGSYTTVDWEHLHEPLVGSIQFIRVTGTATAAQASDVISAIARFRAQSNALVISNAVVVEGTEGIDELANASLQQVKSFDVLEALLGLLEPAEAKAVKELLEDA